MVRSSASARSRRSSKKQPRAEQIEGEGSSRSDTVAASAEAEETGTGNATTTSNNNTVGTGSDTASGSSSSAPSSSVNNDTNDDDDDDEKDLFFYERWNREITGIREKLDEKLQMFVQSSQHEMDVLTAAVTGIVSNNALNETASKPIRVGVGPKPPTKKAKAVTVDVGNDECSSTFDVPVTPVYKRFSERKSGRSRSPGAPRSPQSRALALLTATSPSAFTTSSNNNNHHPDGAVSPPPIHTVMSKASSKASKASDKTELANNLSRRRARRLRRLRHLKAVNEEGTEDKKGNSSKSVTSASVMSKSANSNNSGKKEELSGNTTVLSNIASTKEENEIEAALKKSEAIKPKASLSSDETGPNLPPSLEQGIPEKVTPPTATTTMQHDELDSLVLAFNKANAQTNKSKPPVTMPKTKRSIRKKSSDHSRKNNHNDSKTTDEDSDAISLARSEQDRRDAMLQEERQRQASMFSRRRRKYFFPSSSSQSSSEKKKHGSTTSDSESSTNLEEEGSTMTDTITDSTSRANPKQSEATGKHDEKSPLGAQQMISIKNSFASGQTPLSPVAESSIESPRNFWVQKERETLQKQSDQSTIEARRAHRSVTGTKDRSGGSNAKTVELEQESRKLTENTHRLDYQPPPKNNIQQQDEPKELETLHSVTKQNDEKQEPTPVIRSQKAQQTLPAPGGLKLAPAEHQPLKLKAIQAHQRGEAESTTSRNHSHSNQAAQQHAKSSFSVKTFLQDVIDVHALETKEKSDKPDALLTASTVPRDHRGAEHSNQRENEPILTVDEQKDQDRAVPVQRDQEVPTPTVRKDQTAELNLQRDQTVELSSNERNTTHSNSQKYRSGYYSIDGKQLYSGNDFPSGSRTKEEPRRRMLVTRTPVEPPPSITYSQAREFFMLKDKKNDAPTKEDLVDEKTKRTDPPEVGSPFYSPASSKISGIRTSFSKTSQSIMRNVDFYGKRGMRSVTSHKQKSPTSRTESKPGEYLSISTTNLESTPGLQEATDPAIVPAVSSMASPLAASSMGACSSRAVGPAPSSPCLSPTSSTRSVVCSFDQSKAEESVASSVVSATIDDREVTPVHTNVGKRSSDSSFSHKLPSVEHLAEPSAKFEATSSATTNLNTFSKIDAIGDGDDDHDWNEDNMDDNSCHSSPSKRSVASQNGQASESSSVQQKRKVAEACKQRLQLDISGVHESEMSQSIKDVESRTVSTLTSTHVYSRARGQEESAQKANKAQTSTREELPYYFGDANEEKKEETTAAEEEPVVPHMEHVKNKRIIDPYGDAGMYTGVLIRGKPDSYGIMEYEDGRVYTGSWKRGRWDGHGKTIFTNGDCYTGEYYDDQRQGIGRYEWADGRIYDGRFEADQREGTGIYSWPDGSVYNGEFHKGLRHGNGTYTFGDGSVYNGGWKKGKQHGIGECVWKDGRCYRGEWENGRAHGYGIEVRADGTTRYDGIWIHDRPVRQKTKNRVEQKVKRSTLMQMNAAASTGKTALNGRKAESPSPLSKATPVRTSSGSISPDDDEARF